MSTTISGSLRLAAALTVVLSLLAAGYLGRSPWIVVLAAPALTVLYALGKYRQWRLAWRFGGWRRIALAALTAVPVQLILGAVFYLIGLGLSRLLAPAPIAALAAADLIGGGLVFLSCLICSLAIIRLEAAAEGIGRPRQASGEPVVGQAQSAGSDADTAQAGTANAADGAAGDEVELAIDPTPLTAQTFFLSPGYWRADPLREAQEGRGRRIPKLPLAASEADIAAAEQRLGITLPPALRRLYRLLDGGYVGPLYVARKADPGPFHDDWRGAFSIDYSSLSPLKDLRTVRAHYEDFTDDPDDFPAGAERLFVLQARYGDMTLLDYSAAGEPRVLIVDFDRNGAVPDAEFETFDEFFNALRRPRPDRPRPLPRALYRSRPLQSLPESHRAAVFWGGGDHPFANLAKARNDGFLPQAGADDALIAATEARLGVKLPAIVTTLWRARNGGDVAYRFLGHGPDEEMQPFDELVPLEYFASLAELSRRIDFPPGEPPWQETIAGAEKLVVLNARRDALVLLDYRVDAAAPALLVIDDFGAAGIANARVYRDIDEFFAQLQKFERSPLLP